MVINKWIAENEILDFYRYTNGKEQVWTYRVKETQDRTFKGRINYVLGTPSLASAISDVKHIVHEYELTDHTTSYFTIDFAPTDTGPGVFRAHSALLKKLGYKCLIDNTIKFTVINDITDKNSLFYKQNLELLQSKIQI